MMIERCFLWVFALPLVLGFLPLQAQAQNASQNVEEVSIGNLGDVYARALQEDAILAASQFNTAARKTLVSQSRSRLLPQLSFSYSGSRVRRDTNYEEASIFVQGLSTSEGFVQSNWQVRLDQPIINLSASLNLSSAKAIARQADVDLKKAEQDMVMRTVQSYLDILRARDGLENVLAEEAAFKRQLDEARQKFELGLLPVTDVLEAQAAHDDTVARRIQADGNQIYFVTALKVITNHTFAGIGRLAGDFPIQSPEPEDVSYWIERALEYNLDIQSLKFAVQASRRKMQAVEAERLPTVDAMGRYAQSEVGGTAARFQGSDTEDKVVMLTVSLPLFRSGGLSARIREATLQREENKQRLIGQRRLVESQVRNMYQQVLSAVSRVLARKSSTNSAASALEAVTASYNAGTRTILDVLQAQKNLHQSRFSYEIARYDYILSGLGLRELVGLLSDGDIRALNEFITTKEEANIVRF